MWSVLHICLVFRVVLLSVFTFKFLCSDVCYDFRIENEVLFVESLPPVVCKRAHVFYKLCVFVCIVMSNPYCVVFLFCFSDDVVFYILHFINTHLFTHLGRIIRACIFYQNVCIDI